MKNSIKLFLLLITFQACDIVVDLDIEEHRPVLVLNTVLNPDSVVSVHLSHSLGAFEVGAINPVSEATVRIYEDAVFLAEAVYVLESNYNSRYLFEAIYPKHGSVYTIEASHEKYETVTAQVEVPVEVSILNVEVDTIDSYVTESFSGYQFQISFSFEDDPSRGNYYFIQLIDSGYYYPYPIMFYSNDQSFGLGTGVGDSDFTFWGGHVLFTDALFNGNEKQLKLDFWADISEHEGFVNSVNLRLVHVSEEYYLYKKSRLASSDSDDFFGGEPTQVFTNIQNGLGVLVAETTDQYLLVIE